MTISIFGHEISISGPSGIMCIVLGVVLIVLAAQVMHSSGSNLREQQPSGDTVSERSEKLSFVVLLMAAQSSQAAERLTDTLTQEADTREETGEDPLTGWVYVGPADKRSEWAFSVEECDPSPSSSVQLESRWIQAKQPLVVRKEPYSNFTGTWIGKMIGVREPDVIGVIEEGDRAYVSDEVRVGIGVIWVEISLSQAQSTEQK